MHFLAFQKKLSNFGLADPHHMMGRKGFPDFTNGFDSQEDISYGPRMNNQHNGMTLVH
jgi:hypothetical protein